MENTEDQIETSETKPDLHTVQLKIPRALYIEFRKAAIDKGVTSGKLLAHIVESYFATPL